MTTHLVSRPRWPVAVLLLVGFLVLVFGASMGATAGDFEEAVNDGTYGAGMGLFSIGLTVAAARGSGPAWLAHWYLPAFLAAHVIWLGVWVPDLPLAVLSAAALVALRPAGSQRG